MRILIVRLSSFGDVIHTFPALTDLRASRPDVSVDWLVDEAFASVARMHPATGAVRPVTNLSRKVKAVWNILTQSGLRSNVIGWWPSHPAEPIDGVMVSNHYQRARKPVDQPWPVLPGTVHPPDLAGKIAGLRIHPGELDAGQILPFIPRAAEIDQEKDPRLVTFKWPRFDRQAVSVALGVAGFRPQLGSNQVRLPVAAGRDPVDVALRALTALAAAR